MLETLKQPKSLPHSEESERAILAGVLLDNEVLASIAQRLEPDDFYGERHQTLYRAMVSLQRDEVPVDMRTLQARLEQQEHLERIGGVAYLAGLDVDLPDLGRIDTYVELVKERSVRRRLISACTEITRQCYDGGLEAQEALNKAEQSILSLGEDAIRRGFVALEPILRGLLEDLEERSDGLIGLPTGYIDLDAMTSGLHPGNLVIIAGRPGMGKTSLALNIAQQLAIRERKAVGIFSLEMSQTELGMRILSAETDISFRALRSGHLSQKQWKKLLGKTKEIADAPLHIDESANPSLLEVASKARRLRAEHKLELLVLDYLQLMHPGGRYENRNLEIAAITRGLKQLAKELQIPIIALSQLSRQPERRGKDRRPQLADLRESGSIEQDADLVMFIYREEVYDPETEDRGIAELIVSKHRNGQTGTVKLVFLGESTKFCNLARGGPEPPPF